MKGGNGMLVLSASFTIWLLQAWGIQVAVLHLTHRRARPLRFVTVVPAAYALLAAGLSCGAGTYLLLLPMPMSGILLIIVGLGVSLVSGGWGAACLLGWLLAWRWPKDPSGGALS